MEDHTKGMNLGIGFEERSNYCVVQNCVRCSRSEERGSVDVIGSETKPKVLQYAFGYQRRDHSCWIQEEPRDKIYYCY